MERVPSIDTMRPLESAVPRADWDKVFYEFDLELEFLRKERILNPQTRFPRIAFGLKNNSFFGLGIIRDGIVSVQNLPSFKCFK